MRWCLSPQAPRAARRHASGWRAPLCGHPRCPPGAAILQGGAVLPRPEHRLLPAPCLTRASRTPRAPRHPTAGCLTLPAAAAPPPSRPVGVPGLARGALRRVGASFPSSVHGLPWRAAVAGSRRRCEQEAPGGSASPLHGGSSPGLRL